MERNDVLLCSLFRPRQNPTPNIAIYSISNARKDMEGSYLCRAKNAAGETEDLLQIVVNENDEGGNGRSGKHEFLSFTCIVTFCISRG